MSDLRHRRSARRPRGSLRRHRLARGGCRGARRPRAGHRRRARCGARMVLRAPAEFLDGYAELVEERARPRAAAAPHRPGALPPADPRGRPRRLRAPARDRGDGRARDRRGIRRLGAGRRGGRPVHGVGRHRARGQGRAARRPGAARSSCPTWPTAGRWRTATGSGSTSRCGCGDATTAFDDLEGDVDVVVSNPPYIPVGAVPVDPEVRDHDPAVALYGGSADGLAVPLAVAARAAVLLRPGGVLVMEHADSQGASLPQALRATRGVGRGGRPRRPLRPAAHDGGGPGPGPRLTAVVAAGARPLFDQAPARAASDAAEDEDQQGDDEQHTDDRPDQVGTTHGGTPLVSGPCGRSPARDDTRGGGAR